MLLKGLQRWEIVAAVLWVSMDNIQIRRNRDSRIDGVSSIMVNSDVRYTLLHKKNKPHIQLELSFLAQA